MEWQMSVVQRSRSATVVFLILRTVCCVLLMLVSAIAVGGTASSSVAGSQELSGRMAIWQRIVGTWTCELRANASNSQPEIQEQVAVQVSVAAGNVLHWHFVAADFEADDFQGYSEKKRVWWENDINTIGHASLMQSTDNVLYTQISDSNFLDGDQTKYRVTYRLNQDGTFTQTEEQRLHGAWEPNNTVHCRRAR
jgi:hypothetical protein